MKLLSFNQTKMSWTYGLKIETGYFKKAFNYIRKESNIKHLAKYIHVRIKFLRKLYDKVLNKDFPYDKDVKEYERFVNNLVMIHLGYMV